MNVILVNGIYDLMPSRSLGPYLLRHVLSKNGYSCQVIDHCQEFTADELYNHIVHFVTDDTVCLGFSTTFWRDIEKKIWDNGWGMPPNLYHASVKFKQNYPHIKLVLGGAGIRNVGDHVDHVDALVVGESEDLFIELLDHWTKGTAEPPVKINETLNKPYYNTCINKTYDISKCDFMWSKQDCIVHGEPLPLETARGCIFKCKFCSYPHLGKKKFDYLKPLDHIRNHMMSNHEKFGTTHYIMLDDTFNDSEHKIDGFLEMTRTLPFKIGYVAYIRADLVHRFEGMAEKLQESGLEACFFGLESLHPAASMAVGKGWSGKHAREYIPELLHNIWKDKVNVTTGFIVGLPRETEESLLDTLKWVNDNDIMTFWLGLGISSPESLAAGSMDGVAFSSEFERNAGVYGYKFDDKGWWYTELFNHHKAQKFAMESLNFKRKLKRISCWFHIQLRAFGYTDDELWDIAKSNLTHNGFLADKEFNRRKIEYVRKYKELLMTL
jgi:hypothetical protein